MAMTVYARGFLGNVDTAVPVERTAVKKPFPTIFDTAGKQSIVVVNPEVMKVYEQLVRKDINPDSWDWRETVIRTALKTFGTKCIYEWAWRNIQSPTVSQTHVDFIADMFTSVFNSRERRLPPKTWEDLIAPQARDGEIVLTGSMANIFRSCRGDSWYADDRACIKLSDAGMPDQDMPIHVFIQRYLSKSDGTGLSDLVVTMNTLFGDFTFH